MSIQPCLLFNWIIWSWTYWVIWIFLYRNHNHFYKQRNYVYFHHRLVFLLVQATFYILWMNSRQDRLPLPTSRPSQCDFPPQSAWWPPKFESQRLLRELKFRLAVWFLASLKTIWLVANSWIFLHKEDAGVGCSRGHRSMTSVIVCGGPKAHKNGGQARFW